MSDSRIPNVVAGACAGFVGTIVGYPLDSIKTRMQTGYKGNIFQIARRVQKEEGIQGLFRGILNPLVALVILNTLNFSLYEHNRNLFRVSDKKLKNKEFEWKVPLAAACVGPFSSMISTPFEMVKTQMVVNPASGKVGALKTTMDIVRNHGISTMYRAHAVNTSREIVFLSCYFTVYEHFKQKWIETFNSIGFSPSISIPIAGGMAGATGWLTSLPLDGVKSKIQGAPLPGSSKSAMEKSLAKVSRPSAFGVAAEIVKKNGIFGLYNGAAPSVARAFLVSAVRFSIYEQTLYLFRNRK